MNLRIAKSVIAIIVGVGLGAALLACWYPFGFSLAWPGLILARIGVPHSWVFAFLVVLALLVWLGVWARTKAWWQVIAVSLFASLSYCAIAFFYVARMPVPVPAATPYDSRPEQRNAYLMSYDSGYRDGMTGVLRTYSFYPPAETRGFYEGAYAGSEVWYRLWGRPIPESRRRLAEISAGRDSVRLQLKGSDQKDSSADRAQPVRSETNRTSAVGGPGP